MISIISVIFLREGTFHADNSPGCGGLKTEDNYDQHQIQLILLIVSLAHLLSLQGKAEQYYIYYPFRNQFLHFILDIGVLCSVRESQIVFSAFFLIHSIYCFLSLIQRLQKLKFVEALIENWFSRELSEVLNSITIFQLTPTWAFIDIICFKNWTLHLSNNSFIEKLFSVPSKEEIQTFSLLVRNKVI